MEIGGRMLPRACRSCRRSTSSTAAPTSTPNRTSSAPSASSRRGRTGAGHIHVDPVRRRRPSLPGRGVRAVRDGGRAARAGAAAHARPGAARLRAQLPARDHRDPEARRRGDRRTRLPHARGAPRRRGPLGAPRQPRGTELPLRGRARRAPLECRAAAPGAGPSGQNARHRAPRCCARPRSDLRTRHARRLDRLHRRRGRLHEGRVLRQLREQGGHVPALLDEQFADELERLETALARTGDPVEEARAAAEELPSSPRLANPSGRGLYQEFAAHAARNDAFREQFAARERALRERMADLFERWTGAPDQPACRARTSPP